MARFMQPRIWVWVGEQKQCHYQAYVDTITPAMDCPEWPQHWLGECVSNWQPPTPHPRCALEG